MGVGIGKVAFRGGARDTPAAATDVLAGAALGLRIGSTVPALHLALGAREAPVVIAPAISPGYLGASLAGRF